MSLPFMADIEDEYFSDEYSHYTDDELAESPNQRKARLARKQSQVAEKGHCRKCGQHVGRGVGLHEMRCAG